MELYTSSVVWCERLTGAPKNTTVSTWFNDKVSLNARVTLNDEVSVWKSERVTSTFGEGHCSNGRKASRDNSQACPNISEKSAHQMWSANSQNSYRFAAPLDSNVPLRGSSAARLFGTQIHIICLQSFSPIGLTVPEILSILGLIRKWVCDLYLRSRSQFE